MIITKSYPHLKSVVLDCGLNLNRSKDFKFVRIILVNLYSIELA